MPRRSLGWAGFLAVLPLSPAPAPAAQPSATAEADLRFQALGAWMQRLVAAMAPMNESAARFGTQMQSMPPPAKHPAERARQVAAIRAMIADVRSGVQESRSRLAQMPRFEGRIPGVPNLDFNRLLAEVQVQTDRMLAYMDDTEAFVAAVVRGDPAATDQAARKIVRGGFLLIDSQVILYRGRQSLFPADRSAHQLVGIGLHLYRAMQAAAQAWYRARLEGDPSGAALAQRTRFLEIAGELEADLRQGRANLARERTMFASQKPLAARDPNLARILARVEDVTKSYVDGFAMGDELAAWLRARAGTRGPALAAQSGPEFILELSRFEQRLQASGAEAAASIARQ